MSRTAELLTELSHLLSSVDEKQPGKCSSSSDYTESASTITLEDAAHFSAPDGSSTELTPGRYRVDILPEGHLLLTSQQDNRHSIVSASRTWHELELTAPLALSVPVNHNQQNIMVLFPGGGALLAGSSRVPTPEKSQSLKNISPSAIADAIFKWITPLSVLKYTFPFNPKLLFPPWIFNFGTIEPNASPAGFAPMIAPPNWVGATVVNCYGAPAGSYGPGGPGTGGGCAFTPGESVLRGPFAGYVTSVTPVTATTWRSMAGHVVQLLVTSVVLNTGNTTLLYSTWTDTYQITPSEGGPVSFPGVILATGRSGSNAPYTSWVPDAATAFTTAEGTGVPVSFELRVDGITVANQNCKFNAQFYYPQTPAAPLLLCP